MYEKSIHLQYENETETNRFVVKSSKLSKNRLV